jgi:RND family efflux transporter MFP subunit
MSRTSNRSPRKRSTQASPLGAARAAGFSAAEPTAMPMNIAEPPLALDESEPAPAPTRALAAEAHMESAQSAATLPARTSAQPASARLNRTRRLRLPLAIASVASLLAVTAVGGWLLLGSPIDATATVANAASASTPAAPPAPPPAVVSVAEVESRALVPKRWVSASVHSRSDARLAAEVGGRVLQIAEVGERVEQGALLARLDSAALELSIREQQARIGRFQIDAEQAARQLERYRQLGAAGHVSGLQLDEVQSRLESAQAQRREAEAALAQLRLQVERSSLRAPFDGVVVERFAASGELLGAGAAMLRLVDTADLEVRARAPVALAAQLGQGTPVELRMGESTHALSLGTVVPVGDEVSRQLELRLPLNDLDLPVGSAVELALPTAQAREVLVVPRDAVVLRREGSHVLRVNAEGLAERVEVVAGESDAEWIEVEGALRVGESVVVRGAERLREGQAVAIFGEGEEPAVAAQRRAESAGQG